MKRLILTLLFALTFIAPTHASEFYYREKYEPEFKESKAYKEAKPLIEACWALSEELRSSPNTNDMRNGHLKTALCLEDSIKEQGKIIFQGKNMEDLTDGYLDQLKTAQIGFEHLLYNDNAACQPLCGQMWHLSPNTNYADLLEDVLYRIIWVKQKIVIPGLKYREKQPEFERIEREYEETLKLEKDKIITPDKIQPLVPNRH